MNNGQLIIYVGRRGRPDEYRKEAIYIGPDAGPYSDGRHIIKIKRERASTFTLATVKPESIEERR